MNTTTFLSKESSGIDFIGSHTNGIGEVYGRIYDLWKYIFFLFFFFYKLELSFSQFTEFNQCPISVEVSVLSTINTFSTKLC